MSGDFQFTTKSVNPIRCNEKPWDLWVSEIGHSSPSREEDAASVFLVPEASKGSASRRLPDSHLKTAERERHRRVRVNRLKHNMMSLHGLFPQMDTMNAVICHMCGMTVKCSAAYRHLIEYHAAATEPILPPPPPAPTVKLKSSHSRSKHKKEPPPAPVVEVVTPPIEQPPVHSTTAPLPRIVVPQPDIQYITEEGTSTGVGEVQVCMEGGELPVVSIQDTAELPLGENITDDIFAIMNSEGIQSADDISDAAAWKNIIRDIGGMQDINFQPTPEQTQSQELYTPVETSNLPPYSITEDLTNLQFASTSTPMVSTVIDTSVINAQSLTSNTTVAAKVPPRPKSSKSKYNMREYDPNKHCGVVTQENQKPCTRSLTCKAHALSLRRNVEGRSKLFDTLLAEHRASREATANAVAAAAAAASSASGTITIPQTPPAPISITIPPSLVTTNIDLSAFNGLTEEQQVNEIYTSLLSVEDPNAVLPDTSSITSLLSQVPSDQFLLPDDAELVGDVPILSIASPVEQEVPPAPKVEEPVVVESAPVISPTDVCWYQTCPRPLAVCTFNGSHAGGAFMLGKKFATVRSNIKSSLSRSGKASGSANNYYNFSQNSLGSLSKSVHLNNASKSNKPEVRKLILTCGAMSGKTEQSYSDVYSSEERHTHNGHLVGSKRGLLDEGDEGKRARSSLLRNNMKVAKHVGQGDSLDLNFMYDPLMADEKC